MCDPTVSGRLFALFTGQEIESSRIVFRDWSPHWEMLADYGWIDLALAPFPFNGGVTTCDALWMGVPVVTCAGETFASRHSLSHLFSVGLTATIARDLDEYVALAAEWAGDLPRLAAVRTGLCEQVAASPLCNSARFAANLMACLREKWRHWATASQ